MAQKSWPWTHLGEPHFGRYDGRETQFSFPSKPVSGDEWVRGWGGDNGGEGSGTTIATLMSELASNSDSLAFPTSKALRNCDLRTGTPLR